LLLGTQPLAAEFIKTHACRVADLMTRDVIVATPDTPLRHIAALLEKNGIKRVPIVSNGKVVGIVSRANLVQALASARKEIKAAAATSDRMIREELCCGGVSALGQKSRRFVWRPSRRREFVQSMII
jgi:predicted transcriptional regulator